jgi:hypothetical protein
VDLLESLSAAGLSLEDLHPPLVDALKGGRLDSGRLRAMATEYSTASYRHFLEQAMLEVQLISSGYRPVSAKKPKK